MAPALTVGCAAESMAVLGVAVAFDQLLGEPPTPLHPVVWMGKAVVALERRAPASPRWQLAYGAGMAFGLPILSAALAGICQLPLKQRPWPLRVACAAVALKATFAIRALDTAGRAVEADLAVGSRAAARGDLRALVSRETTGLDASLIAAAAIESLSENLTDSVVGPLLAYAFGGLPAAYAYRCSNTLDSMIGYRGRYEYLGKSAARLDDMVNFIPARLATGLLLAAAPLSGAAWRQALRALRTDRGLTTSPNAGWTMSAAAGALGLRLQKPDHYVLNGTGRDPGFADIGRARRLVGTACGGAVALAAATTIAMGRRRGRR